MHGFALNVSGDLAAFAEITPCGLSGVEMTSISREREREISVREVADRVGPIFARLDEAMRQAQAIHIESGVSDQGR
jgi:lipoate-protein ligase B